MFKVAVRISILFICWYFILIGIWNNHTFVTNVHYIYRELAHCILSLKLTTRDALEQAFNMRQSIQERTK